MDEASRAPGSHLEFQQPVGLGLGPSGYGNVLFCYFQRLVKCRCWLDLIVDSIQSSSLRRS